MVNIKRFLSVLAAIVAASFHAAASSDLPQKKFNDVPSSWKWISGNEVMFSYDGTYTDSLAFSVNARTGRKKTGVRAPEKYTEMPLKPEGAVNLTYSPDSSMLAFTRDNDLYVADIATGRETRLTFDGTDLILNGYASWVYYEEILGRPSRYRAFWWSPDGKKIGFYRFDNTQVPLFPIYSPFGQDGKLDNTRYPKAGERNPEVRIGIADVESACSDGRPEIVWADFDRTDDQYFGIPFWSADSREFFVARMPRIQNTLDLYSISAADGSKKAVYHEQYDTWIDWISDVTFTEKGLYMARRFETGWEQIYFLSYDGSVLRRLTSGRNWGISLIRVDEKTGEVFFTARRDSRVRETLYRLFPGREDMPSAAPGHLADCSGNYGIEPLTDISYDIKNVRFSSDGKYFAASFSNYATPVKVAVFETYRKTGTTVDPMTEGLAVSASPYFAVCPGEPYEMNVSRSRIVADMAYEGYSPDDHALPRLIWLQTPDGFSIPAAVTYPSGFDHRNNYPVHVDIYGGPDTPLVRDRWTTPSEKSRWWSDNGIIQVVADCRAAGHNGRAGTDMVYRNLTDWPVKDFISWAEYLQTLPYVKGDKIGVEGFSFGGTMTAMLLFRAPDKFHYGVAGGGVYDWALYDSHYTERYMETPQTNPEGYKAARAIEYVDSYPVTYGSSDTDAAGDEPVMLKLTHGTGDDNVHFQNTLQLIDALQKACRKFDFMIYPDGMHGYRGYQQEHFTAANREFWLKYLKNHNK